MERLQAFLGPLTFFGLFLGAVVLSMYVVWPLADKGYEKFSHQLNDYQSINYLKANLSLKDSLSQLQEAVKQAESVRKAVPTDSRASFILGELVGSAKGAGLELTNIVSLNEINHSNYLEFPFELQVDGQFSQLQSWLAQLENKKLVFGVRGLSLLTEAINKSKLKVDLEVSAYVFNQ